MDSDHVVISAIKSESLQLELKKESESDEE